MLEMRLEELILKTKKSFTDEMWSKFSKIMKNVNKDALSPQASFDIILKFYEVEFNSYDIYKSILDLSNDLQKIIMVYSCYFAMEYVNREEHPDGIDYPTSIKKVYPLAVTYQSDISEKSRRQRKDFNNIINFTDPLEFNPALHKFYEIAQEHEAHIYNGNLLKFLKNTVSSTNEKLRLKTISPSIVFLAFQSFGHLPNAEFTNRSSSKITINTFKSLDEKLNEDIISFYDFNANLITYKIVQEDYLLYEPVDSKIAKIINYALIDDLFKLKRLHFALECYDSHIKSQEKFNLTKEKQYCYASICSLLSEIPLPCFSYHKNLTNEFLHHFSNDDIDAYNINLKQMLFSTSFLFSFTTGLFCYLLFGKYLLDEPEKNIKLMRKKISELSKILIDNEEYILNIFTSPITYVWDNNEIIEWKERNKTKGRPLREGNWAAKKLHKIHISYVNDIMLNPSRNYIKAKKFIYEASWQNDINSYDIQLWKRKTLNPLQYIDEWYPWFWMPVMAYQSNKYTR